MREEKESSCLAPLSLYVTVASDLDVCVWCSPLFPPVVFCSLILPLYCTSSRIFLWSFFFLFLDSTIFTKLLSSLSYYDIRTY